MVIQFMFYVQPLLWFRTFLFNFSIFSSTVLFSQNPRAALPSGCHCIKLSVFLFCLQTKVPTLIGEFHNLFPGKNIFLASVKQTNIFGCKSIPISRNVHSLVSYIVNQLVSSSSNAKRPRKGGYNQKCFCPCHS